MLERIAIGLLILAALLTLGHMDYADAELMHADCLNMVEQGAWPAEVCE